MKKAFISLLTLIVFNISAFSQDTIYYYGSNNKSIESFEKAKIQDQIFNSYKKTVKVKTYSKNDGAWKLEKTMKIKNVGDGLQSLTIKSDRLIPSSITRNYKLKDDKTVSFIETTGNKKIREGNASSLIPLILEGEVKNYYKNGQLKSVSFYENGQLVSNSNWLKDGTEYINDIFYSVDEDPEYSYGNQQFRNHLMAGIRDSKFDITQVNDQIILGWVIMEDGSLEGIHVVKGKIRNLNALLMDLVVNLPGEWIPAKLDGKTVRCYMTIPFNFSHERQSFETLEFGGGFLIWD